MWKGRNQSQTSKTFKNKWQQQNPTKAPIPFSNAFFLMVSSELALQFRNRCRYSIHDMYFKWFHRQNGLPLFGCLNCDASFLDAVLYHVQCSTLKCFNSLWIQGWFFFSLHLNSVSRIHAICISSKYLRQLFIIV